MTTITVSHIDGTAIDRGQLVEQRRFPDPASALAWVGEFDLRRLTQVTLQASSTTDVATFALRHIGADRDSGWRGWVAGQFVGGVEVSATDTFTLSPDAEAAVA